MFQSKVFFAIIGVIIVSSVAVAVALATSTLPSSTTTIAAVSTTAKGGATATPPRSATATPTQSATAPSSPTATAPAVIGGQPVDWTDVVGSVGTASFTLRQHAPTITIDDQTLYRGGNLLSFAQLAPGMGVEIQGTTQSNGTVLAAVITQQGDN